MEQLSILETIGDCLMMQRLATLQRLNDTCGHCKKAKRMILKVDYIMLHMLLAVCCSTANWILQAKKNNKKDLHFKDNCI